MESEVGVKTIALITGAESVLVDREINRLISTSGNSELTRLEGSEVEPGTFSAATAPSLFSEARTLVLRDLQDLSQECYEEIERYLDRKSTRLNSSHRT